MYAPMHDVQCTCTYPCSLLLHHISAYLRRPVGIPAIETLNPVIMPRLRATHPRRLLQHVEDLLAPRSLHRHFLLLLQHLLKQVLPAGRSEEARAVVSMLRNNRQDAHRRHTSTLAS